MALLPAQGLWDSLLGYRGSTSEYGVEITFAVQYMHNLDSRFRDTVKHNILANGKAALAGTKIVTATPRIGVLSQQVKTVCDEVYEAVGSGFVVVSDVAPDFKEVTACSPA